ncbi:MAG: hypothetical protein PHX70_03460 [Clostridium sp.]|nr:hypothetical protein [Clostridium sp.]
MNISIKRDQIILKGILEKPKNISKCPIVILMHGFTSNKGMDNNSILYILAHKLLDRNIASVRFDFNGLGESSGNLMDMTVENEIEDGKAILEYVKLLNNILDQFI